jgi:uncharacterized protein YjiS (DUF1127 family)
MAWADTTSSLSSGPVIEHRTIERRSGLAHHLWERFLGWRAQRETIRQLYSLDAATLRDIGISPREIESVVYGGGRENGRLYDADWWRVK